MYPQYHLTRPDLVRYVEVIVMVVNTITEAKRQLSELIEKVQEGEEVIINKAGKPVALLTAYKNIRCRGNPGH